MQKSVDQQLDAAQQELAALKKAADDITLRIEEKQKKLSMPVTDSQEKYSTDLRNQISDLEKKWDGFSVAEKILHAVDVGAQIAALKGLLGKAVIDQSLAAVPAQVDILVNKAQRESLIAAEKASGTFLKSLRQIVETGAQAGGYAASGFIGLIRIDRVRFEGDARKIIDGVIPSLTIDFTDVFKRQHALNVAFDFNNPSKSAQKMAKNMINFVIGKSQ